MSRFQARMSKAGALLTQQAVVHPAIRHQIVGAQPGEHPGHLPAVDDAAAERQILGDREGRRVREEGHPPVRLAVEQGDEHHHRGPRGSPAGRRGAPRDRGRHPPRQPPMMFTSGEPETSSTTSIASIVACA